MDLDSGREESVADMNRRLREKMDQMDKEIKNAHEKIDEINKLLGR